MRNSVRLRDVAFRANVSLTTASHAFSGRRPVSAETRAVVLQAAFDLGFTTDTVDRGKSLGLLLRPPEALPGFLSGTESIAKLTGAVTVALLARGYSVVAFDNLSDIGSQIGRLEGFVLLHPNRNDEVLARLLARGLPTVSFDPDPGHVQFKWWVGSNYYESCRRLIQHMLYRGSRQVALIIGQTENMYMNAIASAYLHEMKANGMTPVLRRADTARGHAAGREAALSIFSVTEPVDAIVTSSGIFADGVLSAAHAAGLAVPDDLIVATMMDGPLAENARVPVTALRVDTTAAAARLVELLDLRLRASDEPNSNSRLELEMVERASTLRTVP